MQHYNTMSTKITPKGGMKKETSPAEHLHTYLPAHLNKKMREEAEKTGRTISGQLKVILEKHYKINTQE